MLHDANAAALRQHQSGAHVTAVLRPTSIQVISSLFLFAKTQRSASGITDLAVGPWRRAGYDCQAAWIQKEADDDPIMDTCAKKQGIA